MSTGASPGAAMLRHNLARIGWAMLRLMVLAMLLFSVIALVGALVGRAPGYVPAAIVDAANAAMMIVVLATVRPGGAT